MKAVPVINENDTVATTEIRYGDNDRLAARVATMMGADLLVLLSDIDGLYTAPPALDPKAKFIPVVERITPEIEAMAGAAASELSRGGMRTKLEAGKIATAAGTAMIITSGARQNPLAAIERGERSTLFQPSRNAGEGLQELDRRPARAGRAAHRRRRRGRRAAVRASRCCRPASSSSAATSRAATRWPCCRPTAARSRAGLLPMTPPMP